MVFAETRDQYVGGKGVHDVKVCQALAIARTCSYTVEDFLEAMDTRRVINRR